MRKWLDKAWAKAAAFVLTLVLGGLTVLGGIGIGILVSYNVFLDDGAYPVSYTHLDVYKRQDSL